MKIVLILCILSITLPVWGGTITDNFNDGNFNGWTETWMKQNQTIWKVESGVLIGENLSNWSASIVIGDATWMDYEVKCDARLVAVRNTLPTFGICFRHNKQNVSTLKTLWFGLNLVPNQFLPIGTGIVYLSEDQQLVRISKELPVEMGKWYQLMINVKGDHFEGFVDGKKVIDINDNSLPSGAVGLEAHAGVAEYDNIVITGNDIPDMNLRVQTMGKLANLWSRIRSE